jgi:hypothetical protein
MCFGSTGMFEQDDVENWVSITSTAGGSMARRLLLNNRMGLDTGGKPINPPVAGFHGPGTAYVGYGEYNQRALLARWADYLERPVGEVAKTITGESRRAPTTPGAGR